MNKITKIAEIMEDLDKVIEVRDALINSNTLEEWLEWTHENDIHKLLYFLQAFARAHKEVYGD